MSIGMKGTLSMIGSVSPIPIKNSKLSTALPLPEEVHLRNSWGKSNDFMVKRVISLVSCGRSLKRFLIVCVDASSGC